MGMGLERMTYQLEGKRQLLSLPYIHGPSHIFQFSYCKVKWNVSAWKLIWKRKEKKKGTGDGWCERVCNKKQENNPVKKHPLNKTKGSANKHMKPLLETMTSFFSHIWANINKTLSLKMFLFTWNNYSTKKTNYSLTPNPFISFYK